MLGDRLMVLQLYDPDKPNKESQDVPRSKGDGKTGQILEQIRRLGLKPITFCVDYQPSDMIDFFNKISVQLTNRGVP